MTLKKSPKRESRKPRPSNCTKMPLDYEIVKTHLLSINDPEHRLFGCVMLVSGPRVGEICEMRRCDIDGGYIKIRKNKLRGRPKEKVVFRKYPIPIPDWLQGVMDATLATMKRNSDDYLFQSRHHAFIGKQLTRNGANFWVKEHIFKGVETPGQVPTAHTFRKTVCDHLVATGGNDYELGRKHLDHQSIATTVVYLDKSRGRYEEAVRAAL